MHIAQNQTERVTFIHESRTATKCFLMISHVSLALITWHAIGPREWFVIRNKENNKLTQQHLSSNSVSLEYCLGQRPN